MQWCLTLLDNCVKKVVQVLVYTSKLSIKTEFQNQISKSEDLIVYDTNYITACCTLNINHNINQPLYSLKCFNTDDEKT